MMASTTTEILLQAPNFLLDKSAIPAGALAPAGPTPPLADALKTVADIAGKLKADPGAPFELEALKAIAVVRKLDAPEYARFRAACAKAKIPLRDLNQKLAGMETDVVSQKPKALPLPPLFYQPAGKNYWREDASGKWISLNQESASAFIVTCGYSKKGGSGCSEASRCLMDIQSRQNVDYAAALAGYKAGFYTISGSHVLVTESPRLVTSKAGEWPLLKGILEGMFNNEVEDQRPYFYGWMKKSLEGYYAHQWSPGQVMVLAGPVASAKSLLQGLITMLFGGRSAKPYLFMTNGTTFNGDLFRAEHLMIEDDAESTNYQARRHFGASIKGIAVNHDQHCHGKNKDGLTLTPIWRATISLNDEPERLMVLPPIDPDIADKIMLLKVARKEMPMPTGTQQEQKRFWDALVAELPAFVNYLQRWEIPPELRSPRFGIRHYHHPELLSAITELSPEYRLLALIDREIFKHKTDAWKGSAVDLEGDLLRKDGNGASSVAREAEKLLYFNSACGTYLGKLAQGPSKDRVSKRVLHGQAQWTIEPPALDAEEMAPDWLPDEITQVPGPKLG